MYDSELSLGFTMGMCVASMVPITPGKLEIAKNLSFTSWESTKLMKVFRWPHNTFATL